MAFSHHSHSGQFCGHAQNTLEGMVQTAIQKKMHTFALTEHMPRPDPDLYPEEIEKGETTATLQALFRAFHREANRLREKYTGQISVLIGMEIDWIRPSSLEEIRTLLDGYEFDLFVGSVHHVHGIPTDYNREMYLKARTKAGGTDERLFEDYFDLQLEMLQALRPPIVGHFDLIRLLCDEPNGSFERWPGVWGKIERNLALVAEYGGVLEINSAALRKGMKEPYPQKEICKEFIRRGGLFTLSDDSHSVSQVATHYEQVFQFLQLVGLEKLAYFRKGGSDMSGGDSRFPMVSLTQESVADVKARSLPL